MTRHGYNEGDGTPLSWDGSPTACLRPPGNPDELRQQLLRIDPFRRPKFQRPPGETSNSVLHGEISQ